MTTNTIYMLAKNLKYLRLKNNYTQDYVADKTGCKRNAYKEYEYTRTPPLDVLIKISGLYNLSVDHLIKTDIENNPETVPGIANNEPRILVISVDKEDKEYIEFVPEKAKAGYLTGYANPQYIGSLPKFRLPNLPVGTYRAFEISGDSMPTVPPGSIVIGKYVENFNYVHNLLTYILVTKDDGFVYKRIINKAKNGELICISDNARYEPYKIAIENILEIWSYHCHIDFNGNNNQTKYLLKEVLNLSDDVQNLENIISQKLNTSSPEEKVPDFIKV